MDCKRTCTLIAATLIMSVVVACTPSQQPAAPAEPEMPQAPQPTLDLSREHIKPIVDETGDVALTEPEPLLADMFDSATPDKKVKLDGNLITDKQAIDLMDKVDGVEVTVEIQTP